MSTIPTIDPREAQALLTCLEMLLPISWESAQISGQLADDHGTATFSYTDCSGEIKVLDPGFDIFDDAMQILDRMRETARKSGHAWNQVLFSVSASGQFKFEYGYDPVEIF